MLVFGLAEAAISAELKTVEQAYPMLSSGVLSNAKVTTLPKGVILRSGSLKITQKQLDDEVAKAPAELRTQLKSNLFFLLENKAASDLLLAEAKAWAKKNNRTTSESDQKLLQAYFENMTSNLSVPDEEAKGFFESNKSMMGDANYEQVKDQVKAYLLAQKRQGVVDKYINTISKRNVIEIDGAWVAKQYVLAMNNPVDKVRKSGKPSIVDFGADGCQPCEMMTPILDSLKKEYAGKLNVLFVHVRKEQVLAARYGIQAIPVQIFFDKSGKEVFRHVGFFPKEQIIAKLAEMGVK